MFKTQINNNQKNKFLWHSTKLRLLNKIMNEGLKPQLPRLRPNKPNGIYLSENMFQWMHHATFSGDIAGVALKINVEGLKLKRDFHSKDDVISLSGKINLDSDYICKEKISPDRIMEAYKEVETNSFEKIE